MFARLFKWFSGNRGNVRIEDADRYDPESERRIKLARIEFYKSLKNYKAIFYKIWDYWTYLVQGENYKRWDGISMLLNEYWDE